MHLSHVARRRIVGYGVLLAVGLAAYGVYLLLTPGKAYSPRPLKDLGDAPRTQVVAALDQPIDAGKNAVWCASFISAWKQLQNGLSGGPLELDGAKDLVASLNAAVDPAGDVPKGSLYAAAGWAKNGIAEKIQRDVAKQFPGSPAPKLPALGPMSLLAYARLEVKAKFPTPYFDAPWPTDWIDGAGKKSSLRMFGIHDADGYNSLRRQPRILFTDQRGPHATEFALDLNDPSEPVQIPVAQVSRKPTLAETLAAVDQACSVSPVRSVQSDTRMLVPEMAWRVEHAFNELTGLTIQSGNLKDAQIKHASQLIEFRLDRSGAELRSESRMMAKLGIPTSYIVSKPFLLVLRQRTSQRPFFVVWVDNDELLKHFSDRE
jgi:hypothetical protein